MVKKGFIRVMFAAAALSLASCATNSDIDELKDQLGDLENQIGQLEKAQQEALMSQIGQLQSTIAALQAQLDGSEENHDELVAEYEALLQELQDLQNDVASGNQIYYGNVASDIDYDLLASKGATIVTGDVYVSSNSQAEKLANVTTVGGNVYVQGGDFVELNGLTAVGMSVVLEGMDSYSEVYFNKLGAVSNIEVRNNQGEIALVMPELVAVDGDFNISNSPMMMGVIMPKLANVEGDMHIISNDFVPGLVDHHAGVNISGVEQGYMAFYDVPAVNVGGNLSLAGIPTPQPLVLGTVGGDIAIVNTGFTSVTYAEATVNGDLVISRNAAITELIFDNLTTVSGNVEFAYNYGGGSGFGAQVGIGIPGGGGGSAMETLFGFDALTVVKGNFSIFNNKFIEVDAFNNVEYVEGGTITLSQSGGKSKYFNVFNGLIGKDTYEAKYTGIRLEIDVRTEDFTGFNALTQAGQINLTIDKWFEFNEYLGEEKAEFAVVNGFENLVALGGGNFNFSEITAAGDLTFGMLKEMHTFSALSITFPSDPSVKLCAMELLGETVLMDFENPNYSEPICYFNEQEMAFGEVAAHFFSCGGFGI